MRFWPSGTNSKSNSSRFATISVARKLTPVTFASGRLMLRTRSVLIGSVPFTNTIGMDGVSFLRISAVPAPPPARMAAGLSAISSAAETSQPSRLHLAPSEFDHGCLGELAAAFTEAVPEADDERGVGLCRSAAEIADQRRRLLRSRRERPCNRAAKHRQ